MTITSSVSIARNGWAGVVHLEARDYGAWSGYVPLETELFQISALICPVELVEDPITVFEL